MSRGWGVAGVVLALASAPGCSLLFDPDPGGGERDGGAIDAALADASPPCIGRTQVALAAINTPAEEEDPAVSRDGTLLVFNRQMLPDQPDIWFSTRSTPCDVWNTPAPLPGTVNTIGSESSPELGPGDTTLTFSRRGLDFDSFLATFDGNEWIVTTTLLDEIAVDETDFFLISAVDGFATRDNEIYPVIEGAVGAALDLLPEDEVAPWLDEPALEMVFAARASGTNQFLIYRARRSVSEDAFDPPEMVPLPQISVEDPWVTSDRVLYYAAQPEVLTDDRDLFLTAL